MFEVIFLIILAGIWIIFATVQDVRSREIANWLNFSLIIFALGFRFFYSLFSDMGFGFFYQGLIGLGIFFILGEIFYYGKVFAGGDVKLLRALGVVLPFNIGFLANVKVFVIFFILFLIAGAVYGLIYSFVLMNKNFVNFKKEFLKQFKKNKKTIYVAIIFGILFLIAGFVEILFFVLGGFIFIFPYIYLYAKSVDEVCMVKHLKVSELREGDWLYKDVKIGKKLIKANWDGITQEDIKLLKRRNKNILIRQGIAFSPAFLLAFIGLVIIYFTGFKAIF